MTCRFSIEGECHALLCYSSEDCGARDDEGNPKYTKTNWEKGIEYENRNV